jgi:hypothetical protein fulcA4_08424
MMKKGIYISALYNSKTGGGIVSDTVKQVLQTHAEINLHVLEFPMFKNQWKKLFYMLTGRLLGSTPAIEKSIIRQIEKNHPDFIFINTSSLGLLEKKIRRNFPGIRVVSLFHNVEFVYTKDAWKTSRKINKLLTLLVTWYNEKLAVRYSSVIITLNKRDSDELALLYGRCADGILPICLQDRFDPSQLKIDQSDRPKKALFVGSNFYANYYGIKWFVEHVAPYVKNVKIIIVGNGFERNKKELEIYDNIEVVGTVESLDEFYYNADFVISPIFEGSGMKTKTAEALMFGKTIFGTKEAFEGYSFDYGKVGCLCNNAEDFICAIDNYNLTKFRFNDYSRNMYLRNYSFNKLHEILTDYIVNH